MSHSVDTSQPPSPATLVIAQLVHDCSDNGSKDGSYTWTQQYTLLFTKAHLATATMQCSVCELQKSTLSP